MRFSTLFIFLVLLSFSAQAQKASSICRYWQKADKIITLTNNGIGMPTAPINGRLHVGAEVGLQHTISKRWNYSIHLGYFSQQSLQRVVYTKSTIGYSFLLLKRLNLRPSLNLSVLNSHRINDEYRYAGNGAYEKVNANSPQVMPALGLSAWYPLAQCNGYKLHALARYEFGMQLPFSELSAMLPINQFHVGILIGKK